jgi:hypothetical protein
MGGYCGGDAAATGVFRVIGCSSIRFFIILNSYTTLADTDSRHVDCVIS